MENMNQSRVRLVQQNTRWRSYAAAALCLFLPSLANAQPTPFDNTAFSGTYRYAGNSQPYTLWGKIGANGAVTELTVQEGGRCSINGSVSGTGVFSVSGTASGGTYPTSISFQGKLTLENSCRSYAGTGTWNGMQDFDIAIREIGGQWTIVQSSAVSSADAASAGRSARSLLMSPSAEFMPTPFRPIVGLPVRFDAIAIYANGTRIVQYEWSFGDGQTASGRTVSHPFSAVGTYPVTLSVTDEKGCSASETKPVTVTCCGGEGFMEARIEKSLACGPTGASALLATVLSDKGERIECWCTGNPRHFEWRYFSSPSDIAGKVVGNCAYRGARNIKRIVGPDVNPKNGVLDCIAYFSYHNYDGCDDDDTCDGNTRTDCDLDVRHFFHVPCAGAAAVGPFPSSTPYLTSPPLDGSGPCRKLPNGVWCCPHQGAPACCGTGGLAKTGARSVAQGDADVSTTVDAQICDVNFDGQCTSADLALFTTAKGACRLDALYNPLLDADNDGYISSMDSMYLFAGAVQTGVGGLGRGTRRPDRSLRSARFVVVNGDGNVPGPGGAACAVFDISGRRVLENARAMARVGATGIVSRHPGSDNRVLVTRATEK